MNICNVFYIYILPMINALLLWRACYSCQILQLFTG